MSIILFIVILGILVFVHEFGHFVAAKSFKIRVDEFALGFPPRLFAKKYGETTYALNAIPIGGYVKIYGEDNESEGEKKDTEEKILNLKMSDAPRYKQAIILSSGILGNLIFAWMLLSIGFLFGLPTNEGGPFTKELQNQKLIVTSVLPGSPAETAGLKAGDEITNLRFDEKILIKPNGETASSFISTVPENKIIEISVIQKGETKLLKSKTREGIVPGKRGIGISMDYAGTLKLTPHKAIIAGGYATITMTKSTAIGIFGLIKDAVMGKASFSSISGPIGIAVMVGDAEKSGFSYLLILTVLISINLAIINLVPFPALDGGRLLFLAIEAIKRKPLNPKFAQVANQIGFLALLLFMVIVTYKDIVKLIK